MKKILGVLLALFIATGAYAQTLIIESNVNMTNFWEKNGKEVQKLEEIGNKIIVANELKRVPIVMERSLSVINAFSDLYYKKAYVSSGILPYLNNDDEAAYVIGHEIAHSIEAYGGIIKVLSMGVFNSKKYEYKADLAAIDYMVKAGYNPVAAIIVANRIFEEPLWDWGFLASHPKGSKRMLKMYEYIYAKYPQYLNTAMTNAPEYRQFVTAQKYDINKFQQKYKTRQIKQKEEL